MTEIDLLEFVEYEPPTPTPGLKGLAHWRVSVAMLGLAMTLMACSPQEPIRLGFLASLSGRASRFDEDARNGVMLGIEQRNAAGGVAGRRFELIVQDYGVGVDQAPQAFQALVDARVDVVIGPYASSVAAKVLPLADAARLLLLAPTVTAVSLAGRDDYMIRLNRTTRDSARSYATTLRERGQTRVALAGDMGNAVFSASWMDDFRTAFSAVGGSVVATADLGSAPGTSLEAVVREMLSGNPDGLIFVASAADAARLAQQAAKLAPTLPRAAMEWAANAALIELGGQAVEGMLVAQAHKLDDVSPRYRSFHMAYQARFGLEPSYSAIASYDAVTVLADALNHAKAGSQQGRTPRDAVLRYGPYEGLQQTIRFDRFGDTQRAAYFTVVRNGRFEMLP